MALQNAFGNLMLDTTGASLKVIDPDGTLQVSNDSKALFFDAFDVNLNKWTTGGTAPSISGGMVSYASNTTASTLSTLRSNATFILRPQSYLRTGYFVQLGETTTSITNNTRWWGYGQNQSSPTAAAPVLNGVVFMVDYADGALYACAYSAGTRTSKVAVTNGRPTDGALHKYEIWFRQAIVYFLIDGVTVANITYPNTAVTSGMNLITGSANFTTAPGTAPVLRLSSASMSDTSGTVNTIGDGVDPYLQATVKAASTAAVAADFPLVVAHHPTSPTPAGTAVIGAVGVQGTSLTTTFTASTTTNAATVCRAGSTTVQALIVSNTSTSTQYVKVYNATSVTLGTTAAIIDLPVAAGANVSLNMGVQGIRLTTGYCFAVTGALGATNNTAGAGGVLVLTSFV